MVNCPYAANKEASEARRGAVFAFYGSFVDKVVYVRGFSGKEERREVKKG